MIARDKQMNVIRHNDIATQSDVMINGIPPVRDQGFMGTLRGHNSSSVRGTEGHKEQWRIIFLKYAIEARVGCGSRFGFR